MGMSITGILAYGMVFLSESDELDKLEKGLRKRHNLEEDEDWEFYEMLEEECFWSYDKGSDTKAIFTMFGHSEYPSYILSPNLKNAVIEGDSWSAEPIILATIPTYSPKELQVFLTWLKELGFETPSKNLAWHLTAYVSI